MALVHVLHLPHGNSQRGNPLLVASEWVTGLGKETILVSLRLSQGLLWLAQSVLGRHVH